MLIIIKKKKKKKKKKKNKNKKIKIPSSVFIKILEPFFDVIGFCSNGKLVEKVVEELFINIANIYGKLIKLLH